MNSRAQHPGSPGSIDDLLDQALRPGGAADTADGRAPDGSWLAVGARNKARVIQRRRAAGVSAAGVGLLVAVTVGIVPGVLAPANDSPVAGPAPTQQDVAPSPAPSGQQSPAPEPSAAPSPSAPSPSAPSPPAPGSSAALEPLPTLSDGSLAVPPELAPDAELPAELRQIGNGSDSPAGAFLQNVANPCAEQSSTVLGGDFVGSRTWSYAQPDSSDPIRTSAELRVDLFVPGAAATAFEVVADRAAACAGSGDIAMDLLAPGRTDETDDGPLQQADELLVIIGGNPEVPGGPEVFQSGDGSALVLARTGDVVVRAIVTTLGQADVGADDGTAASNVPAAEQLAGLGLAGVQDSYLAGRLAASS